MSNTEANYANEWQLLKKYAFYDAKFAVLFKGFQWINDKCRLWLSPGTTWECSHGRLARLWRSLIKPQVWSKAIATWKERSPTINYTRCCPLQHWVASPVMILAWEWEIRRKTALQGFVSVMESLMCYNGTEVIV